jgi:predicted outer membrane repeat protein
MFNFDSSPLLVNCTFTGNSGNFGGGIAGDLISELGLAGTILCENTPDQIYGSYTDNGGNCIASSCTDADQNGIPDECRDSTPETLYVPSDQYPTIASAISAAGDGDTIEIAAGDYLPVATLDTLGKQVALRGAVGDQGEPVTTIDGQGLIRVFQCTSGEDAATVFENLVITGGQADEGGGMMCQDSSPTLTNCVFDGNSASGKFGRGGGIYCFNSSPKLSDCLFLENTSFSSQNYGGGGMSCWAGSHAILENCTFLRNTVLGDGGAFSCGSSAPILSSCIFQENAAGDDAGALRSMDSSPTMINCAFQANSASDRGGGIYATFGSPVLDGCVFQWNSSTDWGSGYGSSSSDAIFIDCVFRENNSFEAGGAIACSEDGNEVLSGTIVCGNTPSQITGSYVDVGGNCIQEFCEDCGLPSDPCPADLDGDGQVSGIDLGVFLIYLNAPCGEGTSNPDCVGDLNGDGEVRGADLGILLAAWGPCQ